MRIGHAAEEMATLRDRTDGQVANLRRRHFKAGVDSDGGSGGAFWGIVSGK